MSLLIKRVYPSKEDFDGNIERLYEALLPAPAAAAAGGPAPAKRFIKMMDYGVTIYLPGEEPDPLTSLADSTPYVARFGHQIREVRGDEDAEDADGSSYLGFDHSDFEEGEPEGSNFQNSEAPLGGQAGELGEPNEEQALHVLRLVFRSILKKLQAGGRLEIMPGRYWSLMQNSALAAELAGKKARDKGALLLEERMESPDKMTPDAVYTILRLEENGFSSESPEGEEDESFEDFSAGFIFGDPYKKDISLFDLGEAFGGGFAAEDDEDDEPWKSDI